MRHSGRRSTLIREDTERLTTDHSRVTSATERERVDLAIVAEG